MEVNQLCNKLYEFVIESESESEEEKEEKEKYRGDRVSKVQEIKSSGEEEIWIMSIDIGIRNLGISIAIYYSTFQLKEIVFMDLIDITTFVHDSKLEKCNLYHSKCFTDWMEHVFQYHKEFFEICKYILIERQPPQGLVGIEQLIFSKFRNKSILISPSSMHKHFNIRHLDYENRKIKTESICLQTLKPFSSMLEQYGFYSRKHDIADSVCIMIFWTHKKHLLYLEEQTRKEISEIRVKRCGIDLSLDEWFDQFKFRPKKKSKN